MTWYSQQMTSVSSPFQCLRSLLPDHRAAYWTNHFRDQADERGFNGKLIPHIWEYGTWLPAEHDRTEIRCHIRGEGVWELIVDFNIEPNRPHLITITWMPERLVA
jgi:hypothetical protein